MQPDIKPSHRGLLHKKLGIPMGQPISLGKLMATKKVAKSTGNGSLMKEATYAANVRK